MSESKYTVSCRSAARRAFSSSARLRVLVAGALLTAAAVLPVAARSHHNTQAEFGAFGSETIHVEGTIVAINWSNPHISIDMRTTGGDVPAGENWRIFSHPIRIMEEYGFKRDDFAVGDELELLAWTHIRGLPVIWPRAIRVNDGPMRSNLRFTDMIDIANGTFETLGIEPPANLNGSPPERSGADTVEKLRAMGLLDENGLVVWPPP